MSPRSRIARTTQETDIVLELELDGRGQTDIRTAVPFLDHMLQLFAHHGFFDLKVQATGDVEIDDHHTVEDVGICLGQAIRQALGDRSGLRRYGTARVPMDEALAQVTVDISNRPYLVYQVNFASTAGRFDPQLVQEFWRAVAQHAGLTLHIEVPYGENTHHIIEAIFKAAGQALDQATTQEPRRQGVPSTKGLL